MSQLAAKEGVPVINTTDSDWVHHRAILAAVGITVEFLCGCDTNRWFVS